MEPNAPDVGSRIRAIREQQGLSLRALAAKCGLSINAISLIERGENSPTVSSLQVLAAALGVKITRFFEESQKLSVVHVRHDRRLCTEGNGLLMESLGIGLHNQQLEPFIVTVDPGSVASSNPIVHPGQEFVYCLEGEIEYRIDDQAYQLVAGDSLLFDATHPHCFFNGKSIPARIILVFQTIEGGHLARERHLDT